MSLAMTVGGWLWSWQLALGFRKMWRKQALATLAE
jgi:hypothetical protein